MFKETPAPPKPTKTISSSGAVGKQKNKFVPLMSAEGRSRTTVLLPGRHTCQCLGQKHSLINNCVECGRIVCSQVCKGAGLSILGTLPYSNIGMCTLVSGTNHL